MPTPGRKPRAGVAGTLLSIRVSEDERARWQANADRRGESLSEFIRGAAEREHRRRR